MTFIEVLLFSSYITICLAALIGSLWGIGKLIAGGRDNADK